MKRMTYFWLAGILLAGLLVPLAGAQDLDVQEPSLGKYARAVRKDKKPVVAAKRFDNDNLPKDDKLSVVGTASPNPSDMPTAGESQTAAAPTPSAQVTPGQSQEERQRVYNEWQQRINDQQARIELLSRELDVAQREYRLRAASFYADAGERMRNQAGWDKEDADYKSKLADQQKALDEAKEKLSSLQEEARKSGVPSSAREPQSQPQETEKQ